MWADRGGVLMPMRRGDAMWIAFDIGYPCAIKIGAGQTNVLNGRRWTERLTAAEQDYIVAPPQPALDGFRTRETDVVRQFVAVPLGSGYLVEQQIAGKGRHGGIQIVIHPMKAARYELLRAQYAAARRRRRRGCAPMGPGLRRPAADHPVPCRRWAHSASASLPIPTGASRAGTSRPASVA